MTATIDASTVLTLLGIEDPKGTGVHLRIIELFKPSEGKDDEEVKAQAFLDGLKAELVDRLRTKVVDEIVSLRIAEEHFPADQPARIEAAKAEGKEAADQIIDAVAVDVAVDVGAVEIKP